MSSWILILLITCIDIAGNMITKINDKKISELHQSLFFFSGD